jgi:uncharacterized membrane protein YphA (DoxX/SURF4 family)
MRRKKISEIISALFIALFVYAATSKLMDVENFSIQISQSPMLTDIAKILAWGVPAIELIISALLVFEITRMMGLYCSFSLMTMFTIYIILASRFSDFVPCSCGGVLQNLSWNQHLVFNIGFVILSLIGVVFSSHDKTNIAETKYEK